jgi:hypothetical protein
MFKITIRSYKVQIKVQPRFLRRLDRHRPRTRELSLENAVRGREEPFEDLMEEVERAGEERVGFIGGVLSKGGRYGGGAGSVGCMRCHGVGTSLGRADCASVAGNGCDNVVLFNG